MGSIENCWILYVTFTHKVLKVYEIILPLHLIPEDRSIDCSVTLTILKGVIRVMENYNEVNTKVPGDNYCLTRDTFGGKLPNTEQ